MTTKIGDLERAVYEILEAGPMTPEKSVLFRKPLAVLVAEKLVRKNADGSHELTAPSAKTTPARAPVMVTLTARVPQEYLTVLDRIGPTRSEALRHILQTAAAEQGAATRKKAP